MIPPPFKTRLLGHPLVALPMTCITLWSVVVWFQNHATWPMTALIFVMMNVVMKASERMAVYRARKQAWDSMAPSAPPRQPRPKRGLAVLLAGMVAVYLGATIDRPGHLLGLGWMAAVAVIVMVVVITRALRRRIGATRHDRNATVQVCVNRPLLRIPSLADAYKALPDHCHAIMASRS